MQRFKNILAHVNLARSEHPELSRAARLAKQNDAKLTVISVIEAHSVQTHAMLRFRRLESELAAVEQDHRNQLETLAQPLREGGIDVQTFITTGNPFIEIIRTALQHQHDLVIKTVSSKGNFHRTFFGCTDTHLQRKCPVPLWLVKPGEPETFRRILVALEPNMEHGGKHDLGINLLKLATSLALWDAAELMIVHAWHAYAEEKLKKHMEPQKFEEYVHSWRQESSNRTWRFTSAFEREIKPKCIHLVHGEPSFVVPKFVNDHGVDLVVIGTLGRLRPQSLFTGDTAERILNRLECSVLAVNPGAVCSWRLRNNIAFPYTKVFWRAASQIAMTAGCFNRRSTEIA